MRLYPVIMCGGGGARLWPASTPSRPKQFISLTGGASTFQDTVARVAGLEGLQEVLIVTGEGFVAQAQAQLAALKVKATLLLEPAARDSAAAMAAAAAWIEQRDPDGVAVVVSVDHHLPDAAAFRAAVVTAAEAAQDGLVTLGIRPPTASTAYGYIRPGEGAEGVRPLLKFVEKPDAATARAYVEAGYLWNSGNFIVSARTLIEELAAHAPQVLDAARQALAEATCESGVVRLGQAFLRAPKISIDYAVMEKTNRAAVLPVDFAWSDLGAWDAVLEVSARDLRGNSTSEGVRLDDCDNVFVRASSPIRVGVVGLRNVAVVVEGQDVLVCALDHSQEVKKIAEGFAADGPPRFASLEDAATWYAELLSNKALPLWWCQGADHARGGFHDSLTAEGRPGSSLRRARVQCRQTFTYATAGRLGWNGPWREAAAHGWRFFRQHYLRPDGLYRTLVEPDGRVLDDTAYLYDQSFALLALSGLYAAEPGDRDHLSQAAELVNALELVRHPAGGFRESGAFAYQSNAHMHLLEAAIGLVEAGAEHFAPLAQEIVRIAQTKFIDADGGFLREFFDADWNPAPGDDGRLVEPGHQFEWSGLMARWSRAVGDNTAMTTAKSLFASGARGLDDRRLVAVNAVWDDFSPLDTEARLWPQTEYLKAALLLEEPVHALHAASGLATYLATPTPGIWHDKLMADGRFRDEPAPASSFYHIISAYELLARTCPAAAL